MTPSERIHRGAARPTNADVEQALGPDEPLWDGLVADLETEYDVAMCDWNSVFAYTRMVAASEAWKRTILWLELCSGCFLVVQFGQSHLRTATASSAHTRTGVERSPGRHRGQPWLGEAINTRFGQARSLADAVLFEFGPSRRRDPAMRHHLRRLAASVAVAPRDADRIIQISSPSVWLRIAGGRANRAVGL
jgi:hypothetical protein